MDDYVGKKIVTTVDAKLDSMNYWNVTITLVFSRTKDFEEWESADTSCKVIDKDMSSAINTANFTLENYFASMKEDPFDGIFKDKYEQTKDNEAG